MRNKTIISLLLPIILLLGSCGQAASPQQQSSLDGPRSSSLNAEGHAGGTLDMLAGGSEKAVRKIKPMDNYQLQRKFPDILYMTGPSDQPVAALTFDDGPDQRFTPQILDVLKKHNVRGTFFVMGSRVKGHPEVVKRIVEEGHALGNHTYWHPQLYNESLYRLKWEAEETDKALQEVVGFKPKLFRPPYGGLTDELVAELGRQDYKVIGWNVDSLDWKEIGADEILSNMESHLKPGAIILMHSGGNWDQDLSGGVEALDRLIPELKNRGIDLITIPELLDLPDRK
ncbi:polysaccharide deacetylase family protein [Paenibacillus senegalensis]|uniref:polysaccharide deacetylase family protein n=1 Tax=Paenibacillus senegalensis TaxID=1465766 RepID=UPI0002893C5E|nr:polysaccharide deacetylase family protein [Paenibacillus senegalensis]